MNRLDALKYFMVASQTLSFKNTATRFSVSPQVITRVIAELERELGEPLFKRNTRSIRLTDFGEQFLPKAKAFLQEEERLFGTKKTDDELSGVVRVTLPPSLYSDHVLQQLLTALETYPHIALDWRTNFDNLKTVDDQIDIGLRITQTPDEHWVAKRIASVYEPIVATPALITRYGKPKDMTDWIKNFPNGYILNPQTGRTWDVSGYELLAPTLTTSDIKSLLPAVLSGRISAPIMYADCKAFLENGTLQIILENETTKQWSYYLYRPYQAITPKRVLVVFELLTQILRKEFGTE